MVCLYAGACDRFKNPLLGKWRNLATPAAQCDESDLTAIRCMAVSNIEFLQDQTFIALSVPGKYRLIDGSRVQLDYRDGESFVWEYSIVGDTLALSSDWLVSATCRFLRGQ